MTSRTLTRRAFVGGYGALAAARAQTPVRVAVYGIGHAHAKTKIATLRSLPQFEFMGICEPDDNLRRAAGSMDGIRWLTPQAMLSDASIELIAVESGVQENLAYARQAVDAGKFVHLDKAPGTDIAVFRNLLHEAERRKLVIQLGYQWRYHPGMTAAIHAARKGWLGDVYSFRARIDKPLSAGDRKALSAFRGGIMFELGCHLIDRAIDLFGKPTRSTGYLWHHGKDNDGFADNTLAILEYPGAVAEISIAAMNPHGNQYRNLEITGTNGSMTVQPFFPHRLTSHLLRSAGPYPAGRKDTVFRTRAFWTSNLTLWICFR